MDTEGLFGSVTAGQKRKGSEDEAEKRKLLRRYDHLAVQALNPFGVSEIDKATLNQIWDIICNGNKTTSPLEGSNFQLPTKNTLQVK